MQAVMTGKIAESQRRDSRLSRRSIFLRFRNNPRTLSHLEVLIGKDEQRLLEGGLADGQVANLGNHLVALRIGLDDFEG
jgi:hypothetical protein